MDSLEALLDGKALPKPRNGNAADVQASAAERAFVTAERSRLVALWDDRVIQVCSCATHAGAADACHAAARIGCTFRCLERL